MQVHYDEGVAIHIGPEPCAVVREGGGEASVGVRIGQPLSRERTVAPGADAVLIAEGNTNGRDIGRVAGTISLPSGATMRLRPPRRWNRMGMRMINGLCRAES